MTNIYRFVSYIVGIVLLSLGSVITIKSGLGVSPITTLPYAITMVTNKSIGMTSAILFSIYVFIQILLLKRDFKQIQFLQILFAILFGQIVNLFNSFIVFSSDKLIVNLPIFLIGVVCTAMGVTLTINANLVPVAPDGLTQVIGKRFNKPFGKMKVYFDATVIIVAIMVLVLSGKAITGIGIGTLISALVTGGLVDRFSNMIKKGEINHEFS